MIKFFRKIRRELMEKNKISKYLMYTIGEIVLVVIGILIALSINNWNEERKDLRQEQLILKQLRSEYKSNLAQLEEKVLMRNEGIEACNILLHQIDNPDAVNEDEFYKSFWQIIRRSRHLTQLKMISLVRKKYVLFGMKNWLEYYQIGLLRFIKFKNWN